MIEPASLPLKRVTEEVFVADQQIVRFDRRIVDFIKEVAVDSKRGRARVCAHRDNADSLHEMLIAMRRNSYVRPHRHWGKVESFHLVEGAADVVVMEESGTIVDVVRLDPVSDFFYRLDRPKYHTVLVESPVLVIHEVTNGPFDPADTQYGPFAPDEADISDAADYMCRLRAAVADWKNAAERLRG